MKSVRRGRWVAPAPRRAGHIAGDRRLALAQLLLVLVAAGLHACSLAWPFPIGEFLGLRQGQPAGGLQLLAVALLAGQLNGQIDDPQGGTRHWQRGAWLGGLFACAMMCATYWWLFISLHVYGGLAAPLTVAAIVLLSALLGLYYAAAAGFFVLVAPDRPALRALVFAALWLLAELARVRLFTGFPWGEGGYAHGDGWARPLAGWIGVHGLTFLAAWLAAWIAFSLLATPARWRMPAAGAVLGVALAWLPAHSLGTAKALEADPVLRPPMSVTLLQGNIAQDEKFVAGTGIASALRWYGDQLVDATSALVVAPETALPLLPQQLPTGYWQALQARFGSGKQAALVGLPLGDYDTGYSNSVIGLKPADAGALPGDAAALYRYDKHHLVPFGEVIPTGFHWFIKLMNIPLGDFNRGAVGQPSFAWQGQRVAPNICYEDLFGEELGARFTHAALAPTVFVNVSNIGWFGNTVAIDQHLQISRMRSLEFDRPMVRATNTGATAIIDRNGQVTHALPRHTRGVLTGQFEGRSSTTPYAWWVSRFGLWPLVLLCLAIVGLALAARRR